MIGQQRFFVVLVIFGLSIIFFVQFSKYWTSSTSFYKYTKREYDLSPQLKQLAQELIKTQRSSLSSPDLYFKLGLHVEKVFEMLKSLNGTSFDYESQSSTAKTEHQNEVTKQEVCPEEFKGKKLNYGYPFFRKGFERVECKDFVPIEKLLTVLISMPKQLPKPAQTYLEVMAGVAKYYPKIRVILATDEALIESVKSSISKLDIAFESDIIQGAGQSALWQRLVEKVQTPYVLIAPDITHFDDDINLERLVRVLSYEPRVAIVGGGQRNLKGQWDIGCQQVSFRNWTATYKGGYYRSFNECIVCDFVSGPVMAKTQTLKDLKFDTSLKYGAFRDIFWRLKKTKVGKIAASCPDVMFNINSGDISDIEYVSFANKHQIHKIIEPSGRVRWYGCRRGYSYTSGGLCKKSKGMALSPADMENLADAVNYFMRACEEVGAFCEIQSGTMMGAVKFNGVLPWEVDADIVFQSANFSALEKLKGNFKEAGYSLSASSRPSIKNGRPDGGYFSLGTTNWRIELWGYGRICDTQAAVSRGQRPTKVLFAGQWVNHPLNPGLFARNRYGAGIYQHQEHWSRTTRSGWDLYHPGKFLKCPQPGHSACLDQYPADGNMQFRDYCP